MRGARCLALCRRRVAGRVVVRHFLHFIADAMPLSYARTVMRAARRNIVMPRSELWRSACGASVDEDAAARMRCRAAMARFSPAMLTPLLMFCRLPPVSIR
jgi:hypothetical protein